MSVPYTRLFRVDPRYRWWRPLIALVVFLGFYLVTQIIIGIAYIAPVIANGGPTALMDFQRQLADDPLSTADPILFSMTLVSLIVLLPSVNIAVKIARLGPLGQLSSVAFRFRWRWAAACLLPLLVIAVVMVGVQSIGAVVWDGVVPHWDTASLGQSTVGGSTLVIALVMIIVGVPFQAAAEEYVFRGFIMQTIGSWLRNPVVGIVVSTVIFAVLHLPNGYNVWGILDVGSFGLVAAIIVYRTGGLEATVLQHALNNIVIFVFQAPGWSKLDAADSDGSAGGALITLGTSLAYWGMVEFMAWRTGLVRRRPGGETPRFRGAAPAWGMVTGSGWEAVPTPTGPASDAQAARSGDAAERSTGGGVSEPTARVDDTDGDGPVDGPGPEGAAVDGSTGVGARP